MAAVKPIGELIPSQATSTIQTVKFTEISEHEMLIEVSLYLRGEKLDANLATQALEMAPSKVFARGEPKSKSRAFPVHALTTWIGSRKAEDSDVNQQFRDLLESIPPSALAQISGVDEAFIDIFIAQTVKEDDLGASIEWHLDPLVVAQAARLGLPIKVSCCNVRD